MDRFRIVFVVPARNEERSILKVINYLNNYGDTIIIDDCSNDNTFNILLDQNVIKLQNKTKQGYQKSVIIGLQEAKKLKYDFAITFDADGQHLNLDMSKFIKELNNSCDLIITQRNIKNRISEYILSFYSKIFYDGVDLLSGVKAYKVSNLKNDLLNLNFNSYCSELAIKIIKKKLNFKKYPINILQREDNPRIGNSFNVNLKILYILIFFLFKYNILNK